MNFLIKNLEQAWELRAPLREQFFRTKTNAFRLLSGADEGVPGLVIEQFGAVAVLTVWPDDLGFDDDNLLEAAEWLLATTGAKSVYRKVLTRDRSGGAGGGTGENTFDPTPFAGEPSPEAFTVMENGVSFEVRPFTGFMTGLFLDQRENRRVIAEMARGKKLLNLFAYTCSFSVAAAKYGAASTTNIDLSAKYLGWGKRNFELNGLDVKAHRFFPDDAREHLRRAAKRGDQYDIVVLDPPSFSRNGKKVFRLEEEAAELVTEASYVVAPGGQFYFSCNYSEWDDREILPMLRECLPSPAWTMQEKIAKPLDFASDTLMKSARFARGK